MAKCDYCGTTILFGGKREANLRFCNEQCHNAGALLAVSQQIPNNVIQEKVWEVHQGLCPKCGARGPIVCTSIQVGRNLIASAHGPDLSKPSSQLEKLVRLSIGAKAAAATPIR